SGNCIEKLADHKGAISPNGAAVLTRFSIASSDTFHFDSLAILKSDISPSLRRVIKQDTCFPSSFSDTFLKSFCPLILSSIFLQIACCQPGFATPVMLQPPAATPTFGSLLIPAVLPLSTSGSADAVSAKE